MADSERLAQFDTEASQASRWQQAAREFVLAANYLIDWYDPPRESGDPSDFAWLHSGSTVPMMVLYATAVEERDYASQVFLQWFVQEQVE